MPTDRRIGLAIVATVAVLAAGVGWFGGQRIRSPADIAAETAPPEASLVTVPVESRVLSSNLVVRGQVEFADTTDVAVSRVDGGASIVTGVPFAAGDTLREGDVAMEIAGRPIIVLQGVLPAFRTLSPTIQGPDIRQLEEALVRIGLDPGVVDDTYDSATEAAVVELYRRAGYRANEPSAEDLERLEQARASVRASQDAVAAAQKAAGKAMPAATRLQLDQEIRNAELALTLAREARAEVLAPFEADVTNARAALAAANTAVANAEARLATARTGVDPDTGGALDAGALATFEAAVADAQAAAYEQWQIEKAAVDARTIAARQPDNDVANAEVAVAVATSSRAEAIAEFADTSDDTILRREREALAEASNTLGRLEAEIGVIFPTSELVFVPLMPTVIQQVPVALGDIASGPVMTVTGDSVQIRSSIGAADRSLLTVGAEALVEDETLGISFQATVAFIADDPGGTNIESDRYSVRFTPVDEVPEDAIGQNLRITVPFASTGGEVLAVPLAALSADADGTARVEVERPDGTVETVRVTPGLNSRTDALVEITPIDGTLVEGDRVVVGRNQPVNDDGADESDTDESDGSDGGG